MIVIASTISLVDICLLCFTVIIIKIVSVYQVLLGPKAHPSYSK